jgi:hypothetical protein
MIFNSFLMNTIPTIRKKNNFKIKLLLIQFDDITNTAKVTTQTER